MALAELVYCQYWNIGHLCFWILAHLEIWGWQEGWSTLSSYVGHLLATADAFSRWH